MALRLVEIILPQTNSHNFRDLIEQESVIGFWQEETSDTGVLIKVLLSAEKTETFLDELENKFGREEGFRVVMLPVEATLPRMQQEQEKRNSIQTSVAAKEPTRMVLRISREELFAEITDSIKLSRVYMAMVVISSIVASVGLLRDSVAVVIGAMVIAPLLGPNVGLAFATTLGDFKLGLDALKTNIVGVIIALALSVAVGYVLEVDLNAAELVSRTEIHLSDIVIALASGSAGVLAFTSGVAAALIGVMVAVALLPPLVTLGLLIGSGNFTHAVGALLLLLTNLICVNLAGVTTFLIQGVRPRTWWEAATAKKATRLAILLWSFLLAILAVLIFLSQKQ